MFNRFEFLSTLGLIPRLMLAVGTAIVIGGSVQTFLLLAEGATESSSRLKRELNESLTFIAPLVADQAIIGEYAAIEQLLKKQVQKGALDRFQWTDRDGRKLLAEDVPDAIVAPFWFRKISAISEVEETVDVSTGGVGYGTLYARVSPVKSENRLWAQFVKQIQILAVTLFLMLQFIWLFFRGNLGTLRMLAESANKFSQGDFAVRIKAEGAPEVRLAAEAFNNMANNTKTLLDSLSESESKNRLLATIVEQSSEAIWTYDLNRLITSWNAGAELMFDYSRQDVIGKPFPLDGLHADADQEKMQRLVEGERFSYDTKVEKQSGAQIDIQVAVSPLMNESNQCIGIIAVARDVTLNKRGEEALKQARETAEMASHAKGSFLARMSHEIRTPMNGVLGMTELLLETGLSSVQRRYAETVQSSGKNLLGIINDILDFTKIEAGKLELENVEMDVRNVLEDVVDLLAERANAKSVDLAYRIPANLSTYVKGDPLRMSQVLTNLTGNAIKFTTKGSVLLSLERVTEDDTHTTLRFEVTDTGLGIAEEAQARIFDEFSQADGSTTRKYGGSGLGLAISKQLVEMMGGTIYVESKLGMGAKFWFTCRLEKLKSQPALAEHLKPISTLYGVRTLVVESTAINKGMLRSQISTWGMLTRVADNPEHALSLMLDAAENGMNYDVAIIDLGLPGTETIELLKAVRRHQALDSTRLVILSPMGRGNLIKDAQLAGANAALVKPIRQSDLYECLINMTSDTTLKFEISSNVDHPSERVIEEKSVRILLVEDNQINQAVAMGMLKVMGGFDITVANNGVEAVNAHQLTPFDIILMDCHMPEMDGYEATRLIRLHEQSQHAKRVPIIALTANAMAQDRETCLEAGMDDHLSKPFSRQQLKLTIDRWREGADKSAMNAADVSKEGGAGDVLDRNVLGRLQELQTEDDPNIVNHILALYLLESPKLIKKMQSAAEAGNALEIVGAAHTLKSSSAYVGAIKLSELAISIETFGKKQDIASANSLIPQVLVEFDRVEKAINIEIMSPHKNES